MGRFADAQQRDTALDPELAWELIQLDLYWRIRAGEAGALPNAQCSL